MPGGATEPWGGGQGGQQADDVHDDRGVGPWWEADKPGQASRLLPVLRPLAGLKYSILQLSVSQHFRGA